MARLQYAVAAALLLGAFLHPQPPKDPYAPLRLYDGAWDAVGTRAGQPVHDHIVNACRRLGTYFLCDQTVNGKEASLIVFVPTPIPGRYHTQGVVIQGFATGRGDLAIDGPNWVYSSQATDHGNTTYFRTLNHFRDDRHIHYDVQESTDGKTWATTASGDETHS